MLFGDLQLIDIFIHDLDQLSPILGSNLTGYVYRGILIPEFTVGHPVRSRYIIQHSAVCLLQGGPNRP